MIVNPKSSKVYSWGYGYSVHAKVICPLSIDELLDIIEYARKYKLQIIAMGGANSFGNVFLRDKCLILNLSAFNTVKSFDSERGLVVAEGGSLIRNILSEVMPKGWFLKGVSGSIDNTVGGAIASNVHGKDSWSAGNFGSTVISIKLLKADGTIVQISETENRELFHAVVGGLGLLGIILEVTLRLSPIISLSVLQRNHRASNISDIEELLYPTSTQQFDFAFSWIDGFASGKELGRGIVETGSFISHSTPEMLSDFERTIVPSDKIGILKPKSFWRLFKPIWSPFFLRNFNLLKYYTTSTDSFGKVLPYPVFNFPWAQLPGVKYSFYPQGFREYQVLFSRNVAISAFKELLDLCKKNNHIPILCSIKRHRQDFGHLSFSGDGLSISINFLLKNFTGSQLTKFLVELIDITMKYGGIVYLAKFSDLPVDVFRSMYPQSSLFLNQKSVVDPNRMFWSETAERLFSD